MSPIQFQSTLIILKMRWDCNIMYYYTEQSLKCQGWKSTYKILNAMQCSFPARLFYCTAQPMKSHHEINYSFRPVILVLLSGETHKIKVSLTLLQPSHHIILNSKTLKLNWDVVHGDGNFDSRLRFQINYANHQIGTRLIRPTQCK
jgi:hypothetical protein